MSKRLKIIRFLVYSDVWVGLAVGSFCWLSMQAGQNMNYPYIFFAFFSTVAAYNYMRIVQFPEKGKRDFSSQKFWMQKRIKQAVFFTVLFSACALYFYIKMFSYKLLWLTIGPAVISLVYPLSFNRPLKSFTSLRDLPGLKMFLIAVSWAYVTQLCPLWLDGTLAPLDYLEFIMRSILICALIIPFDIRDIRFDDASIGTLPQKFGIPKAKFLSLILIVAYLVWKLIAYFLGDISAMIFISWTVGLIIAGWLIIKMRLQSNSLYTGFWIEAAPVYVVMVYLILNWVF